MNPKAETFWGCDIGGSENTFAARLLTRERTFIAERLRGAASEIARHIWASSKDQVAPIVLALDAVLSHDLDSAKGWRPADLLLRSLLDRHLTVSPGASIVVSPSAFMGHRHLELSGVFGAYAVVVETHPTACLAFMGAPVQDLWLYKKDHAAFRRIADWLTHSWFTNPDISLSEHGEVDAVVCAMVAAAVGGHGFTALELFTPTLSPGELPRPSLAGAAPYYSLRKPEVYMQFVIDQKEGDG